MHLCSIVAARPNFMKLAGFQHAFAAAKIPGWKHSIVHTGQHYDPLLSDVFFQELEIPEPDENLGVKGGETNEETVARTQEACLPALRKLQPDLVIVYGDVSGALGGAQAAKELGIPIAHVEAGLRSFDRTMPEERNRIAIDRLADLLFITEQSGIENLSREGITRNVHFVGNTMIDTLMRMTLAITQHSLQITTPPRFGVVTLHRPSNVDDRTNLQKNVDFLNALSAVCPLVFPIHPRTEAALSMFGLQKELSESVWIIKPLGYLAFLKLILRADFVLTDSGGIQEETTFLRRKCFTLRENTERPVTCERGTNQLIRNEDDKRGVLTFAAVPVDHLKPQSYSLEDFPPQWDGRAGERIMGVLQTFLNAKR